MRGERGEENKRDWNRDNRDRGMAYYSFSCVNSELVYTLFTGAIKKTFVGLTVSSEDCSPILVRLECSWGHKVSFKATVAANIDGWESSHDALSLSWLPKPNQQRSINQKPLSPLTSARSFIHSLFILSTVRIHHSPSSSWVLQLPSSLLPTVPPSSKTSSTCLPPAQSISSYLTSAYRQDKGTG